MFSPLLAFVCFASVAASDLMAFGDSWGTTGAPELARLAARKNFSFSDESTPGTTATFWARFPNSLKNKVDDAPDTKVIWHTIGGNDFIIKRQTGNPLPASEIVDNILADAATYLDPLFAAYPNMTVVGFGYEIFSWGTLEEEGRACNDQAEGIFGPECTADGLDKKCANEMWLNLHDVHRTLADKYTNYFTAEIMGTLQTAGGVPGASVGSPNLEEFSSPVYFEGGGCIHANDKGYYEIFDQLYNVFLQYNLV